MAKKKTNGKMPQPLQKEKLSTTDMEKLGRKAGKLAREIELIEIGLAKEKKKAKEKIEPLKEELSDAHEQLRTGYKLVSAQQQMFDGD